MVARLYIKMKFQDRIINRLTNAYSVAQVESLASGGPEVMFLVIINFSKNINLNRDPDDASFVREKLYHCYEK